MTSPFHSSVTENKLVRQINHISLEQTDRIIEAVKKTHVPYETLQITEAKLAESEAKTDFLQDKFDDLKRKMYDMMALHLQSCGRHPPLPSIPPPTEPGFHKRASAQRAAILALPDTSPVIYAFPARDLHVSAPSLKALCSKDHWLHDDVLDTSGSASELCKVSVIGDRAEMNPLIIKLARSGFSWDSTRHLFVPLRPLGLGQWLLVWVDMEAIVSISDILLEERLVQLPDGISLFAGCNSSIKPAP
ncbi:hypothetical protein DFP73DRAFT_598650 [Morchella snyderi]|nr:hypothetical protein DFP73DRAFT_598650 [Morchella snyderi]